MSRLRFQQKQQRVLRFLRGSIHPAVFGRLVTRGFSTAVYDEGNALLANAVFTRSEAAPRASPADNPAVAKVAELEKLWVPVAQASLERRHPAVFEPLFRGYQRVGGVDVILMVRLFVERSRALAAQADDESRAAVALLASRGLTAAVVDEMDAALAAAMKAARPIVAAPPGEADEAERAMWDYYLEWSRIARTVIKEPELRRAMGFLDPRARPIEPEPEPDVTAPPEGAVAGPEASGPAQSIAAPAPA